MMRGSRASSFSRLRRRLICTSMLRSNGVASRPKRQVHQLVAIEHPVGMLDQHRQQPVLGTAQRHDHAVGPDQVARTGIQDPAGEPDALRAAQRRRQAAGAPQDALDAGQQFARAERLAHVVVGAHLDADDAIDLFGARSQHDHRHVRPRAQFTAQGQPVLTRHHHVEHDDVGLGAVQHLAHLPRVPRDRDLDRVLAQVLRQQIADVGVVIDDEYMVRVFVVIHDVLLPAIEFPAVRTCAAIVTRRRCIRA